MASALVASRRHRLNWVVNSFDWRTEGAGRAHWPGLGQRMTKYTHGDPISRYIARKARVMSAPRV